MPQLLKLRPYQQESLVAVASAWATGVSRPAVVLPTGTGKTVIFSHLAKTWTETYRPDSATRNDRVLILVHRDELVRQTEEKLHDVAPGLDIGVIKADRNDVGSQIMVASVQTLARASRRVGVGRIGCLIVDECHHAAATSYTDVMRHFGSFDGRCDTVGFSATLTHTNKNALADTWESVVFERDILDMIPGYLCDVRGQLVTVNGLSLSEVQTTAGDFQGSSLSDALISSDAVTAVIDAYERHARGRKTVVFVSSVAATEIFTDAFLARGHVAGSVVGTDSPEVRRETLRRLKSGELDVIVNCMVLTEGFDEPSLSCAIIARPTTSAALYVQMVGRVLRLYPGKVDALVLDVVGASLDHRLATIADLTRRQVLEIAPGESLTAAVAREREAGNPSLADYVIDTREIDLFRRSRASWLRTLAGVWFIRTKDLAFCLWPTGTGTYRIGLMPLYGDGYGEYLFNGDSFDLDTAMAWSEQYAGELEPMTVDRDRSWRYKSPSGKMIDYAERFGIQARGFRRAGELSDAIAVCQVSGLIDDAV